MSPKKKQQKKKKTKKKTTRKAKAKTKSLATLGNAKKAAAIVSQVLVHFGAGYGSVGAQIFATPADAKSFSDRLIKSTMKNLKELNWENDGPGRDAVCSIAFKHGGLARTEAGGKPLTWKAIKDTLDEVKKNCPAGAGGGLVCVE